MPDDNVPQFKILANGRELAVEAAVDVIAVTVSQYTQGADVFIIEINNWNSDRQEFKWVDNNQFTVGVELEIKMGYLDHVKTLIKGEITALEPEFQADRAPRLKVQGYDRLHRFRRDRKTRSFINMKDSQVAEQIARELRLQPEKIVDTEVIHPYVLQNNQTSLDFLQERARRIRYEVDVVDRTLVFRPVPNERGKVITIAFGGKLKSFYPRLSTMGQVSEVVVRGWNPQTKEAIDSRAGVGDEIGQMAGSASGPALTESVFGAAQTLLTDHHLFSKREAEQIAKAQYNAMALEFITGEGTAIGDPELVAGEVIELARLGQRFSGFYYVTAATHVINQQGYSTLFCVQRNAV